MSFNADRRGENRFTLMGETLSRIRRTFGGQSTRFPPGLPPGRYFWGAHAKDRLWVSLNFVPHQKMQVDMWWNSFVCAPVVTLCFGLYPHSVEFGELLGNGFNHPQFHQKGFGSLAVNTAVQALQSVCSPATRIEGLLSNTEEDGLPTGDKNRLAKERRFFWSRFGVGLIPQGPLNDIYLCGTVGALTPLRDGQVADQFPRFVPLESFSPARPELP